MITRLGKKVENLSRIEGLMNSLDNPQNKLKFIHIAGTNGKGSTAEMFSRILIAHNMSVGTFTSPFILVYNDRIRINLQNIGNDDLNRLKKIVMDKVEISPEKDNFSQFEITMAIALLYFAEQKCDIVVFETGLGGLLDCTNIIEPMLSVITTVDFDHMDILGRTIEEIAYQKAGIIKDNVPCVIGPSIKGKALEVIVKTAEGCGSKLVQPNINDIAVSESKIGHTDFVYKNCKYVCGMYGRHQLENAVTVIEGINLLNKFYDIGVNDEEVAEGIKNAVVMGRVQIINKEPLIIVDGSHNPEGMKALGDVLKSIDKKDKPIKAVIGMCSDKNISNAVINIIPYVSDFITVDGFSPRAEEKQVLADIINGLGGNAGASEKNVRDTINEFIKSKKDGIYLICGSLFLLEYTVGK